MLPALICFGVLCAGTVFANDRNICNDDAAEQAERVAACERVLAQAENRVNALINLAEAYSDNEDYQSAIGYLDEALDLNPDRTLALGRRSLVLVELRRWSEAEADIAHLLEVDPTSVWGHYLMGNRMFTSSRPADAIPYLERAVELDPDYRWAWSVLASSQDRLQNYEAAAMARREVTRILPFSHRAHARAFTAFERAGNLDEAAYHARIAHTIDPNDLSMRDWLVDYLGDARLPDLPPLDWTPPPPEREIRYFTIEAPVDTRDEMTRAIEEMINFFGGQTYPMPDTAMILRVRQTSFDGPYTLPEVVVEDLVGEEPPTPPNPAPRLYGVMPFSARPVGPMGPTIMPLFDNGTPGEIWPLMAGNHATGDGRFAVDCSQGTGFSYSIMGCLPGVDQAEVGQFNWDVTVSTDRIQVPMGIFDTYKIDLRMSGNMVILGVTQDLDYTAGFWISPELNTWVAQIITVGENYVLNQAMSVVAQDAVSAEQ